MNKSLISITTATLVSVLAVAGITYAATPSGASTASFDSLIIGAPGTGGVTQFNGTMVNIDANKPLTAGDDFRIDGRVWRGANPGPALGDNQPFIINDDTQVAGTFTVGGTDIFAAIDAKGDKFDVQSNASNIAVNTSNISTNTTNILANTTNIANNASSISAKANTADVVTKASPSWNARTGYMHVHGTDFIPSTIDESIVATNETGYAVTGVTNSTGSGGTYTAPINLPHGATITAVEAAVVDNDTDPAENMLISLISYPFIADTATEIFVNQTVLHAQMQSQDGNNSADIQILSDSGITTPIVDNDGRFYTLSVTTADGSGDMTLIDVKITYTFTSPY